MKGLILLFLFLFIIPFAIALCIVFSPQVLVTAINCLLYLAPFAICTFIIVHHIKKLDGYPKDDDEDKK